MQSTIEIMVVDDDEIAREGIIGVLEDEFKEKNVRVIPACNGIEALQYARDGMIVLLDLEMPVMDGYDFLKQVSAKGIKPRKVLVTGSHAAKMNPSGRDVRQRVRDSYSHPEDIMYLPKPIELDALVSTVITLMPEHKDYSL